MSNTNPKPNLILTGTLTLFHKYNRKIIKLVTDARFQTHKKVRSDLGPKFPRSEVS